MVFQRSLLDLRRGCSQSAMGMCAFIHISNLFGVVILQRSISEWRRGCIHSAMGIGAFFSMSNLYLILLFHIYICWIGGGGGVSLPWVYVHSSICES